MAVVTHTTTDPKTKECKTCACPTCSGLECLCRPRFFAGQLLTDETLNQLDHYIVEKNKLHNRYLHGWGVVCGLEVVCNPCNAVTVRAGYALSPCGDDVIVCQDVTVDVCSLISQCVDKKRDWECQPFGSSHDVDCREMQGDWVLTVRYDEKMTRGITALKGGVAPSCGSGCGCGGSSGCGCGSQTKNGNGSSHAKQYATAGAGTQKYAQRSMQTSVAAQCEPTVTCEGFVFEVSKRIPDDDDKTPVGRLVDYGTACIESLTKSLPKRPTGANPSKAAMYQWCCSLKQKLRDNLFDHPIYNCRLADALSFACPDPQQFNTDDAYAAEVDQVVATVMADVGGAYYQYCLCSSFLPPCPEEVCDPRVPLATITVRKDDNGICRIVQVCNLGERRFLITFPILGYWFSMIVAPMRKIIRRALELICCQPLRLRGFGTILNRTPEREVAATANFVSSRETVQPSAAPTEKRGFKAFAGQVWQNRSRTVDERTYFLAGVNAKSETGNPYLSETELKNPFFTLTVNRVAGPLLAKLPDNSLDTLKGVGSLFSAGTFSKAAKARPAAKAADPADVAELKTRVADLQATVERQSGTIAELQKKMDTPQ
jgi:hypothetical protein